MTQYLVHCHIPGINLGDLQALQRAVIETSRRFSAEGKPVHYVRCTFVPGESHVMVLFEAPNASFVRDVNEMALVPFTRVVEAIDVSA
jgi:hypothetical protein